MFFSFPRTILTLSATLLALSSPRTSAQLTWSLAGGNASWPADKRAAIAAHASQIPVDSTVLAFDDETFAGVYGYEWYVRAAGPAAVIDDLAF